MQFNLGFPAGSCAYHFTAANASLEALSPGERKLVEGFAPKRIGDFAAGRDCARRALAEFGIKNAEILKGEHNEPLWPQHFTGSISHAQGIAGAVVAETKKLRALGLDIEHLGRVKAGMWDLLFSEQEQDYLATLESTEQDIQCTAYFSMKESFYKLQYPLTKTKLWFNDVEIIRQHESLGMRVNKNFGSKAVLPEITPLQFLQAGSLVISTCFLEA